MIRSTSTALLAAVLAAAPSLQAASHTWSGATGGGWSVAANWSAGGAPVNGETNVVLSFPASALTTFTTNNVSALNVTSMTFAPTAGGYTVIGNLISLAGTVAIASGPGSGGATLACPVNLTSASTLSAEGTVGVPIAVTGVVSGVGVLNISSSGGAAGVVTLTGANTYTGATAVSSGRLVLVNSLALGATSAGTFVAGGASLSIGSFFIANEPLTLAGNGAFNNGALIANGAASGWSGPITLSGDAKIRSIGASLTLSGVISGPFGITLSGAPDVIFTGNNTYTGQTILESGNLVVNGLQGASSIQIGSVTGGVDPPTLRGFGTVGSITVDPPAAPPKSVEPGTASSTGILTAGGLNLNAFPTGNHGRLGVRLNGTTPGTEHDVLVVNGAVNVTGALLSVSVGFTPAVADSFVIVANDGADAVVGTFAGLPEGATFVASGRTLQISYVGGTGNDVVLTVTSLTPVALQGFDAE